MDVYIYRAALYCEDCGRNIKESADTLGHSDTGDSDDYPQGPFGQGGGEADSPQHCDACGVFLENSLTSDGYAYLKEVLSSPMPGIVATETWAPFYGAMELTAGSLDEV